MKNYCIQTLLGLISLLFISCGSETTIHTSDFRIFIGSENSEVRETIEELVNQYNHDLGENILVVVSEKSEANSEILFQRGLLDSTNQLGHGSWSTRSEYRGSSYRKNQYISYSMHLNFDLSNFVKRMKGRHEKESSDWKHLYLLFCHEIGHGFQMKHIEDEGSVMFPVISNDVHEGLNYDLYFENARQFLKSLRT